MKTSVKIILLTVAILIFCLALYYCLPAIPKKIKNEIRGVDYTFENISFNLSSKNYVINEELTDKANERTQDTGTKTLILINSQNEKDHVTIMRAGQEGIEFINESIEYLKNPFRHRSLERSVKNKNKTNSTDLILYSSPTKEVILDKSKIEGGLTVYSIDVLINNNLYTIVPSVVNAYDNALEFMRSVTGI